MKDTHSHPTPKTYIIIGVILAIVTVIELWATGGAPESIRVPLLLVLTLIKAGLVAMYFMHLKMDSRLYVAMFCVGIFLFALPFTLVMLVIL